jgi:hypothetical protein
MAEKQRFVWRSIATDAIGATITSSVVTENANVAIEFEDNFIKLTGYNGKRIASFINGPGTGVSANSWLEFTNDDGSTTSDVYIQAASTQTNCHINFNAKAAGNYKFGNLNTGLPAVIELGDKSCMIDASVTTTNAYGSIKFEDNVIKLMGYNGKRIASFINGAGTGVSATTWLQFSNSSGTSTLIESTSSADSDISLDIKCKNHGITTIGTANAPTVKIIPGATLTNIENSWLEFKNSNGTTTSDVYIQAATTQTNCHIHFNSKAAGNYKFGSLNTGLPAVLELGDKACTIDASVTTTGAYGSLKFEDSVIKLLGYNGKRIASFLYGPGASVNATTWLEFTNSNAGTNSIVSTSTTGQDTSLKIGAQNYSTVSLCTNSTTPVAIFGTNAVSANIPNTYLNIYNNYASGTLGYCSIGATGTPTNVGMEFTCKGNGKFIFGATQTATNTIELGQTLGGTDNASSIDFHCGSTVVDYDARIRVQNGTGVDGGAKLSLYGITTIENQLAIDKTITAAGSTGNKTINKQGGSVNFAASAVSVKVTNSLVTTDSLIFLTIAANDTTMKSVRYVASAGQFIIYPDAVPTAETRVNFWVVN